MVKKVILDKADRLYHFPFDLEDFLPKRTIKTGEKRSKTIDLGHFRWKPQGNKENKFDPTVKTSSVMISELKEVIAEWYRKEFSLTVNPQKEIYIGQGIHRTLFDFCLAFVDYGDIVLCPEPGMPFYRRLVIASGGVPVTYPTCSRPDNKPSLTRLDSNLGKAARVIIFNHPNNPIGFTLNDTELDELIHIASRKNVFIFNDAAYCSLAEEKFRPIRAIPGGSKVALEVFSFSYAFGLNYIPLGFAVGPPDVINTMESISATIRQVIPDGWLSLCKKAVEGYPSIELRTAIKNINQSRLEAERLAEKAGWEVIGGKSCPFLWVRIATRKNSAAYAAALLRKFDILTLPGNAFGEIGDGFLRLSLTASPEAFNEAAERITNKAKSAAGRKRKN
jgi:LL-diaminopimelate aminotransferase